MPRPRTGESVGESTFSSNLESMKEEDYFSKFFTTLSLLGGFLYFMKTITEVLEVLGN